MVQQRRAFLNVPDYHKTKQNDREFYVLDDPQFEPENADFLIGYIGDVSELTEEDLARTPQILEDTPERQKYQLGIGTTYIDPDSQERLTGAFYTDLLGQISANGGIVDDPNRVFGTNFYAWTPPIDYDKHINFGRYFWMAPGAGDVAGEFIIKESQGSKATIYVFNGTSIEKRDAAILETLPATAVADTYAELATEVNRSLYRFNGTSWILQEFVPVSDIPTDFTGLSAGDTFYVARTGPEFNRPLVWMYSFEARRWVAQQVVVSLEEPETKRENMVWEDLSVPRTRRLKRFSTGSGWTDLTYTTAPGPSGVGSDGDYIYDSRDYNDLTDEWSRNNWWRHLEDLSVVDRGFVLSEDQANRPILEFWAGLEQDGFIDRDGDGLRDRNDPVLYKKYVFELSSGEIVDTGETTTIFEYVQGVGVDDAVLGFPTTFSTSGEILFDLTLESDDSSFDGYKYYLDTTTGFVHSVWHKSDQPLTQVQDANGLYEIPRSISSNADHQILTESSRGNYLLHMASVIEAQEDFSGDGFGPNSFRWSDKSPARGATIIDSEQTLLRALAMLQNPAIGGMPEVIRRIAGEYNKVLFRFTNKMNQKWDNLDLSDPSGTLTVTPDEAVDAILTELFTGRNEEFPFYYSDMGTYQETRVTAGSVEVVDTTRKPIFIAPSPPRVGPSPCYVPSSFEDRDGVTRLRGHEGFTVPSFGDDRDSIWLTLQGRFFGAVPDFYKTENDTFSTRFNPSNFWLDDYFGDFVANTMVDPVDEVVEDYNAIGAPVQNQRVFSTSQGEFAVYDGFTWLARRATTDETFLNNDDNEYYIFNGLGTHKIDTWNRSFDWDYNDGEFRQILRREFERFILFRSEDFAENTGFDANDPFTWNYSSAGVEGHYRGIYRRVYNTIRPHSHPWEVVGYKIEPTWWRTQYVPTSTASDGTPRYANNHPMWVDFQNGVINPISGTVRADLVMVGPIPVDINGELLDPIEAGVVDANKLDAARLDDIWTYGDGYDIEQEFIDSAFYPYSFSLQGYLMKNGRWTDTVWSEVYISIGEDSTIKIGTAPHIIHRDTLTRPAVADLPVHLEQLEDGSVVQRLGVNAWVSDYVQIVGASPTNDFARVLKNTIPALSWKTSGYIRDNRTIVALLSGDEIPFDDVHTILHASQPIDEQFCSGVVILRENPVGYRVFGFDTIRPFFKVELPAIPVVGSQVEQRESFTAEAGKYTYETETLQLPFNVDDNDTAKLAIIIDGLRIKPQHIKVLSKTVFRLEDKLEIQGGEEITATVVTTPSNPSTQIRQFRVQGVNFPYTQRGNGQVVEVEYGRFFETSSEVINFLLGYWRVLESEGWIFDDIDDTSGQQRDWLFGAKLFAAWVLDNESVWQSSQNRITPFANRDRFEFSPISRKAKYVIPFGQNFNVESLQNGAYGILNADSQPIPADETFSARVGDTLEVEVNDASQSTQQIFGLRVNVSEIQHTVFFSNVTRFNDLIYDPVTALFHKTLRVDSYRTNDWNGRLEAPGYLISGGTLVPNFEKNAFDFTRFYDRINTLDDPLKRDQARNLYGWYPSDNYMDPIGAADRSRFDYYRGMIQTKGTIRPIIAYARGTRLGRDNVFVYEDWAWKVAEYGDVRREKIQFNIDKNEIRDEATVICFGCEDDSFNNTLEVQDFNRTNTVIGTEPVNPADPPPTFAPGEDFTIEVGAKSENIVLVTGTTLYDTVNEINSLMQAVNIIEVEVFVAGKSLAFRNTLNYTVTDYTLIAGTAVDLLAVAGITPGTYTVDNSRWIMPPTVGQDGISNVVFPTTPGGQPDVMNNSFFTKTFDTSPLETLNTHYHYDPELGKFDPESKALVDLTEVRDPARYNRGPETARSNNLVWGEDQVGMLWWDSTRAIYVDYRGAPDYESAAKVWGRLRFFRLTLTRIDEIATVQTLDPFTGTPVDHGLSTGDTVDIIDAEPEDWNVTGQEIFLAPVETDIDLAIPFQPDNALGTVEVPSTVTTTGTTVYDEINTVTGTTIFTPSNFVEGTVGDVVFRVGDALKIELPSKSIVLNFQTFTGGSPAQFAAELNDQFNSSGIFEVEAFSNYVQFVGGQILGLRNRLNREGVPFELSHIVSSHTGSNTAPAFVTGDEFTVQTASDTRTIFLDGLLVAGYPHPPSTPLTVTQVVTEINEKLYDWTVYPGTGQTKIPEVVAFQAGGALGFKTRETTDPAVPPTPLGDYSCEVYTLGPGFQGPDLLIQAGIDAGQYGSVITKAGINDESDVPIPCGSTARYDDATILGIDETGVGSAPAFSVYTDTDLLRIAGIIIPPTPTSPVTGTNNLSTPIARTILTGSSFNVDVKKVLEPTYTTTQTTLSGLITEFNNALVADDLTDFEVYSNANRLAIRLTSLAAPSVKIEVPTAGYTGSIWNVAGLPAGTYDSGNITDAVGTVVGPTFSGESADVNITVTVEFSLSNDGNITALVDEINDTFTDNNVNNTVVAVDSAGLLEFQNTGGAADVFTLIRRNGLDFENPESIGVVGVISAINLALQNAGVFDVEAFFDEFSLGIRNTVENEGKPFDLISGTPDLLTVVGITPALYQLIPVDYSFNLETRSGFFPTTPYATVFSGGLDSIVEDINNWIEAEALAVSKDVEVQAVNSDQKLAFQNTNGHEGKGFRLIPGGAPYSDLLGPAPGAAFSSLAGFFEIIPANSGFDIWTSSGKLQFNSVGGNLDAVIQEFNEQLPFATAITQNPTPPQPAISITTGDDFTITVFSNVTTTVNIVSTVTTGDMTLVRDDINTQLDAAFFPLPKSIEAFAFGPGGTEYLGLRNALGIPEIAFLLVAGTSSDLLVKARIEARLYGGIVEVTATRDGNFLNIINTSGRDSENFVLAEPTNPLSTTDLMSLTGIPAAPTPYGQYEAESEFTIALDNGKGLTFISPDGGTLSKIVGEINSEMQNANLVEVEAVEIDDKLVIRNTTDYSGVEFDLIGSTTNPDLLVATGIPAGPYTTDTTMFSFEIQTEPDSPATGDPKVIIGFIDLYEWVRSPVPPSDWVDYTNTLTAPDHPTGTPLNVDDPSYVELISTDPVTRRDESTYYFWVKDNTGTNVAKSLPTNVIADRLESPTAQAIAWFAPIDANNMLIFQGTLKVEDDYAIEIFIDARDLETHVEWTIVSENDRFNSVPDDIVQKMIDSLSGVDEMGSIVPSPLLNEFEQYGSSFFPIQTVFSSVEDAVDVYVAALNALLAAKDLSRFDPLVAIFQLSDELTDTNPNGFWQRTKYIDADYVDTPIFDTVVTESERNTRGSEGRYINGDLVDVLQSGNMDPWTGDIVTSTYVYQDGLFVEVGVENHTVSINSNIRNNTSKFRSTYERTYNVLEKVEQNSLMFSMLHEMMRQHLSADWFIKTSYISSQIFDTISRSPFVRASEPQAILDNIQDVKPFRTKFRNQAETWTVEDVEDLPVLIEEFPDIKVSMLVDRLACDDIEDGGWDSAYWDSTTPPIASWDRPFWEFEDLGRQEWVDVGDIPGGLVQLSFEFTPDYTPSLYGHRAIVFDGATVVDADSLGLIITFETTPTILRVNLNTLLPINFNIVVQQAQGLTQGPEPTLPQGLLDQGFSVVGGTYEHHLPRVIRQGAVDLTNPQIGMSGCDSTLEPGGKPEERVPVEVIPSVNICVINTWSEALGAWDAAPWDSTGWDTPPSDIGDRVFIIAVGQQEELPPATEIYPTHEDYQTGDAGFQPPYIIGTTEAYDRVQVEVQASGVGPFIPVTEGVEYTVVEPFKNIIEFGSPVGQTFTADGVSTLFGPITIPTGIQEVRLNSVALTQGPDYLITNIAGDDYIDFAPIQPAPRSVTEHFNQESSWIESDGIEPGFEVNLPQDSLTKDNVLVFRDGILEPQANYNVATIADVEMVAPVAAGEFIATVALGNFRSDNQDLTVVQNFDGTGILALFSVGNNARVENTYVFVDDIYQNFGPGFDYTFIAPGTTSAQILFAVAPPSGTGNVEVRIVQSPLGDVPPYIDMENVVFLASGGATDPVPGLFDIDNPGKLMVFVNGVLNNGYSGLTTPDYVIQNNLPGPDEILWISAPPTPGDVITVRFTRDIVVTETIVQDVVPVNGDFIEVDAVPYLVNADIVRYRYNGWPVGRLGPFEVIDFPDAGLQTFSGDNFTNIFVVGNNATQINTTVFVDGEFQQPGVDDDYLYADAGLPTAQLVFNTPPPTGVNNIVVRTDLGFDPYTIEDGVISLPEPIPPIGLTVSVQYKEPRKGDQTRSILVRMSIIAEDILTDHTLYDPPNGFEEDRKDGIIYVNTTDANYYQWDVGTSSWNIYAPAAPGDEIYVRRNMQIWGYDGSSFNLLFDVGGVFTTPPLLQYPYFGVGIMSGTYALGQNASAATDFPEAYEVIQHPGDCGSGT